MSGVPIVQLFFIYMFQNIIVKVWPGGLPYLDLTSPPRAPPTNPNKPK